MASDSLSGVRSRFGRAGRLADGGESAKSPRTILYSSICIGPVAREKEALMKKLLIALLACAFAAPALGQAKGDSIEGYWQDSERRILFSKQAPPGYEYGHWVS